MNNEKKVIFHCVVEHLQEEMGKLCLSVEFIGKPVEIEVLFNDEISNDVLRDLSKESYNRLQDWLKNKSADGGLIIDHRLEDNPIIHQRISTKQEYCEYQLYEGTIAIIPFCLKPILQTKEG